MLKIIALLFALMAVSNFVFAQVNADSIEVDKQEMEKIIDTIKSRNSKGNYIFDKKYLLKDVRFHFPTKIKEQIFNLDVYWKNEVIYSYGIDSESYKIIEIFGFKMNYSISI